MSKKLVIAIIAIAGIAAAGIYFWATPKEKEQKVYRIGISSGISFFDPCVEGFKKEMEERGYIEGKDVVYEIQNVESAGLAYPGDCAKVYEDFLEKGVDMIVTGPTESTMVAKEVTKGTSIPIVSFGSFLEEIVEDSLRHPGGRVTGVRYTGPEHTVERLEILHKIAPGVKRVWLPYLKDYPTVQPQLDLLAEPAESMGIVFQLFPATSPEEIEKELEKREASGDIGMDAILMLAEPYSVASPVNNIVDSFARKHNIPVGSALVRKPDHELGLTGDDYGPVFGWAPDNFELGKLVAPIVDKIIKGIPPGTIPVVTPGNELQINLKVAENLELDVPEELLHQADVVVEEAVVR